MSSIFQLTLHRSFAVFASIAVSVVLMFGFALSASAQPTPPAEVDCPGGGTAPTLADCPPVAETGVLGAGDLLDPTFAANTGLGNSDLEGTIGTLIRTVIRFLGIIAVLVVLYGGFKWMTAAGSDDKVADAKKIMIAGLIGLVIVLTALAITNFIIAQILGATSANPAADL